MEDARTKHRLAFRHLHVTPLGALALLCSLLVAGAIAAATESNRYPGDHTYQLTVGNLKRDYILHVPRSYRPGRPTALVLYYHGAGITAAQAAAIVGPAGGERQTLSPESDRAGFLVAYMDATRYPGHGKHGGTATQWDGGNCDRKPTAPCGGRDYTGGLAYDAHVDDVAYTNAVLAQVERRYDVDAKRVYGIGHSSGAVMVSRLACQDATRLAAIAPMEGAIEVDPCRPAQPVSVLMFQALDDHTVAYYGDRRFPTVSYTLGVWRTVDGCSPHDTAFTRAAYTVSTYASCRHGAAVGLYTIDHGGHDWPFARQDAVDWQAAIWAFFSVHHR